MLDRTACFELVTEVDKGDPIKASRVIQSLNTFFPQKQFLCSKRGKSSSREWKTGSFYSPRLWGRRRGRQAGRLWTPRRTRGAPEWGSRCHCVGSFSWTGTSFSTHAPSPAFGTSGTRTFQGGSFPDFLPHNRHHVGSHSNTMAVFQMLLILATRKSLCRT